MTKKPVYFTSSQLLAIERYMVSERLQWREAVKRILAAGLQHVERRGT